jgi:hypothetical protein
MPEGGDVRFTASQTSFKSGRLSPKLFNRVDTKQYRDGASIMQGFRPISEGAAEVIRGRRFINEELYSPVIGFRDSNVISTAFNGNQVAVVLFTNTFNRLAAYIYRYPYTFGTGVEIELVAANSGPTINANKIDYALVDNSIILTDFNGKVAPIVLSFNSDGTFKEQFFLPQRLNNLTVPYGKFRDEPVQIGNMNTGNRTVDLTSTDPDVVDILQGKRYYYAEALGYRKNEGDNRTYNFIASNFYTYQEEIPNGVRVKYSAAYVVEEQNFGDPVEKVEEESLIFANVSEFTVWATDIWGPDNWFKTVTTHEGRLVFGGLPEEPLTLVGSEAGEQFNLNRLSIADTGSDIYRATDASDIKPTDPYLFTISADEDSEITSLQTTSELFIGTDRREYIATGGDTILSALSVQIKPYTSQGVFPLSTELMGNVVCYIDQPRKKLFQFKFNEANGSFLSDELSIIFNDLLEDDRIRQIRWAPHIKTMFVLTDKEILYGIVYDPSTETQAFYETLQTGVTSICYIAAREEIAGETHHRGDHLLMFVREKGLMSYEQLFFEKGVNESAVKEDRLDANRYFYLEDVYDIKRVGANDYTINGEQLVPNDDKFPIDLLLKPVQVPFVAVNLDTGKNVAIDSLEPDGVSGFFLIDHPDINGASRILVGNYPATKTLATMPVEDGQQFGTAQMGIKRVEELGIRFYKSYSYEISSNGQSWQNVRVADSEGNARTGRKESKFSGNPDYDFRVYIRQTKPEPLTVLGINMRGVSNDG